jgi:6-pyruvoyltetrahydropterin/6-carboxytetrahydropterin synthase
MEIYKEFSFEAAHLLPNLPEDHKCRRLHGHSFRVEVHVSKSLDPVLGWVMDFAEISEVFEPLRRKLDHYFLNEVEGLDNPTSENLAIWIWQRIAPGLPGLTRVVVRETCNTGCSYTGGAS